VNIDVLRKSAGERTLAQVPVPVVDDRVTTIRVNPGVHGEARQQLELDARNARQRYQDILQRLRGQNGRLQTMLKASQNREALAQVKAGLDVLDAELGALDAELRRLKVESGPVGANVAAALGLCDEFAGQIKKRRQFLTQTLDDLEKAVAAEAGQEEKRDTYLGLYRRAEAQRQEADFEEAIKTYEEVLQQFGEREEVRKKLAELTEAWKVKGEEHGKARAFTYGGGAQVKTFEDVRDNLPRAREAYAACRAAGDRLTPLKLLLVASTTATEILTKRAEELEASMADEDKVALKQVQQVGEELQAFIKELSAFVRPG
jgi:tetratricopeptide (TPR) repeat protein